MLRGARLTGGTPPRDPAAPPSYPRSSSSSSKHPNGAPPGVWPTTNIHRSPTQTQSGSSNCPASQLSVDRRARLGVFVRLLPRRCMNQSYWAATPPTRRPHRRVSFAGYSRRRLRRIGGCALCPPSSDNVARCEVAACAWRARPPLRAIAGWAGDTTGTTARRCGGTLLLRSRRKNCRPTR